MMSPKKKTNNNRTAGWVMWFAIAMLVMSSAAFAAQETWIKENPTYVPTGRDDAAMAFDPVNKVVVLFGGDNGGSATWVWDGRDWKDLGVDAPTPRAENAMVYDTWRGYIVMFGGRAEGIDLGGTWLFDGEAWTQMEPNTIPDYRSDHAMAFDEKNGLTIMFGGEGVDGSTWAYNGDDWFTLAEEDESPGPRFGHAMCYDSDRQRIVMFGGYHDDDGLVNDTWEWDGEDWYEVTPADGNPPEMRDHVMVYDSARKKTVLFGGRDLDSTGFDRTWEWDGTSWVEIDCPSRPAPRHEAAAAFDAVRNQVVLFGGSWGDYDTYRYNDETWTYPNNGPFITHTPDAGVAEEEPYRITATIEDFDNDTISAAVYYRHGGDVDYQSMDMGRVNDTTTFAATIPAAAMLEGTLEYYFKATDTTGSGDTTYSGSVDAPYSTIVNDHGSVRIFISPKPARKKWGALWRIYGTDEWHKSGDIVTDLKPGEVQIQFNKIENYDKPELMTVIIERGKTTETRAYYIKK